MNKRPPKFVCINLKTTALRLRGTKYYRDAGDWEVSFRWQNNALLISDKEFPHLDGKELVECSHRFWEASNNGYVPDSLKNGKETNQN